MLNSLGNIVRIGIILAGITLAGMIGGLSLGCRSASAQALTWDPSGNSSFGGGGTWNASSTNWYNSSGTQAWAAGSDAWFTGPTAGGAVNLDGPEEVGNLVFSTSGYVLSGSTLNVSPTTTTTVTVNQNATINSSIADGGSGLTFLGPGVLTLGAAANTGLTGVATVSGGTLNVNGANMSLGGLGAANSIVINSGATVVASASGISNSLIGLLGSASRTIRINQGGLLTNQFVGSTDHLNALFMDGGTLSAAAGNATWGTWNFDGGVSTAGDGQTSYFLGGNACLTQNSGGGTQFYVGYGDTLYVGAQLYNGTGFTNGTSQFSLVNSGLGTLVLAASNNFSTSTLMNNGTLLLANTAALLASPLNISSGTVGFSGITAPVPLVSLTGSFGGTLLLANTNGSPVNVSVGGGGASTTYSGILTGSGGLTVTGGNLTLGGNNNYTGATNLHGGILTLGSPAALGSGTIDFSGGTLQYTSAANNVDYSSQFSTVSGSNAWNINTNGQNVTFAGNLLGSGGDLTKFGLGQLTLAGSDTYSGGTNIDGGVLRFASGSSVPHFGSITINIGGALVASSGSANTVNGWLATGKILASSSGAVALTTSSTDTSVTFTSYPNLSLGALGTVTYAGTITPGPGGYVLGGGGGTLYVTTQLTGTNNLTVGNGGGGTVVLGNSADNWGGTTTIVPGGTLQLGDGMANLVTPTGPVTNNGTLLIPNSLPQTLAGGISGSGAWYAFGTSVLTLNGTNSAGVFYANGGTVNINGLFSSTGKTVFGSNVASAPQGPTVVNWNAIGSMTGGSFFGVADTGQTATLNVNGGSLAIANVTVFVGNTDGGGVGTLNMNAGTVTVGASNAVDVGGINANTNGSAGVVNVSGGLLSISSGTSMAVGGNGSITMGYASNSSATINVTGGTLATGRSFYMGSGAGTLNLNGGVLQLPAGATNSDWFLGGVSVVAGTNGALIDIEGTAATVNTGTINGPGGLTKSGPGSLALNNASNGYTGGSVINNGLLQANGELCLGPVPSTFMYNNITLNGGELRDSSNGISLDLSANRGIYLGPNGGYLRAGWSNVTTVNGVISGGGPLGIATDGEGFSPPSEVYLANPANTYTGGTTIGSASAPASYTYEALSTVNVQMLANGGLPSSIGQSTSAASNLVFNSPSGGTAVMNYVGNGDSTDRLFTIAGGAYAAINASGAGPLNFTNPGAIAFTNAQASTLVLSGNYYGPTPNNFRPQITDGGSGPTSLAVNGSVWTLTASNNTFSGATLLNGGTLLLTTSNALQNSIVNANGGNLAFAAGTTSAPVAGLSGTGSITLQDANANPVTLYVGGNGASSVFYGNLSGPGGLVKAGSGVLALMASQGYGGPTTVLNGTLKMGTVNDVISVAHYTFNGTANDSSGNGLNATLVGGPSYATGLFGGKAIALNGASQYVAVPYNSALGLNAYTVSLWVDVAQQPAVNGNGGPALLGTRNGGNYTFDLQYVQLSTGGYELHGDIGTGSAWLTTAANYTLSGALSGWNMITYAVNSSGYAIYVNGAQEAIGNYSGTPLFMSSGQTLAMGSQEAGGSSWGADGWLSGSLDDATIFGSPLSASQIASLYTQQFGQLPAASPVQVASGGTLDIGFNQTLASLSDVSGAGGTVTSSVAGSAALTLGSDGSNQTFSGAITGPLALTKVGGGSLVLSGTNTFTGGTTVAGGTLILTNNEALADGSSLFVGDASDFAPVEPALSASAGAAAPALASAAPVPEPSALALLAAAALALLAAGTPAAEFAAGRGRRR